MSWGPRSRPGASGFQASRTDATRGHHVSDMSEEARCEARRSEDGGERAGGCAGRGVHHRCASGPGGGGRPCPRRAAAGVPEVRDGDVRRRGPGHAAPRATDRRRPQRCVVAGRHLGGGAAAPVGRGGSPRGALCGAGRHPRQALSLACRTHGVPGALRALSAHGAVVGSGR